ncbi:MAG: hypothetical protein OXF42_02575 [Candidatus Dadabacteria bacterium]|nr:hypothetical protein [Candidatus Dadabacteria bacterium]
MCEPLQIYDALCSFQDKSLYRGSIDLLNALNFTSENEGIYETDGTVDGFRDVFLDLCEKWTDKDLCLIKSSIDEVYFLFQISNENTYIEPSESDDTIARSLFFLCSTLKNAKPSKLNISNLAYAFNKIFPSPVICLFVYGEHMAFATFRRRPQKRDRDLDTLQGPLFVRGISIKNPDIHQSQRLSEWRKQETFAGIIQEILHLGREEEKEMSDQDFFSQCVDLLLQDLPPSYLSKHVDSVQRTIATLSNFFDRNFSSRGTHVKFDISSRIEERILEYKNEIDSQSSENIFRADTVHSSLLFDY